MIYVVLQKIKKLVEDSQLEPPKELTEKQLLEKRAEIIKKLIENERRIEELKK